MPPVDASRRRPTRLACVRRAHAWIVAATGVSGRDDPSRHDTTRRSACARRLDRLAQWPGRQQPTIADAATAVDHDDLAIPRQTIVLQAVVRQDDLGAALYRAPRRRHAIRTGDDDRAGALRQQHRFVADFLRRRVADSRRAAIRRSCRRSRAARCQRARLALAAESASQIVNGVLPVPPTVMLPITTTGRATRMRRRQADAIRDAPGSDDQAEQPGQRQQQQREPLRVPVVPDSLQERIGRGAHAANCIRCKRCVLAVARQQLGMRADSRRCGPRP